MTIRIDGKKISASILAQVREEMAKLPFVPVFCDVLVGNDPASAQYVRMKNKAAHALGIETHAAAYPETIATEALAEEIKKLNAMPRMCGLIVQLPLSPHIDKRSVLDAIDPSIDVDCLSSITSAKFYANEEVLAFPTALACAAVIDSLGMDMGGKRIVMLGNGQLVGAPTSHLLRQRGYDVTAIDSATPGKEALLKDADVIISAIGEAGYIKGAMIKQGAVVIDAGTSEATDAIVGDVDSASVEGVAAYLSPVPGGVGPVTVAMLLKNVLEAAQRKM